MESNRTSDRSAINSEFLAETALNLQQKWQGCVVTLQRQLPYEVNSACLDLHNIVLILEGQCNFIHRTPKDTHVTSSVSGNATIHPAGKSDGLRVRHLSRS